MEKDVKMDSEGPLSGSFSQTSNVFSLTATSVIRLLWILQRSLMCVGGNMCIYHHHFMHRCFAPVYAAAHIALSSPFQELPQWVPG